MGITIVQKSDLARDQSRAKKALILAGGAVTGGSFMAGGVKALGDHFTGFNVRDFDMFVGISSGSLICAPLAGGISPESVLKSLDGTSCRFSQLTALHYYRPNFSELLARPVDFFIQVVSGLPRNLSRMARARKRLAGSLLSAFLRFIANPSLSAYQDFMEPISEALSEGDFPSLISLLPSGVFDNRPIEAYIRGNIERNRLTNDFREAFKKTKKGLYISAMRLDDAKRVVFGHDENHSVRISEAIQASTAMPGFYKPARINGEDYVDGGVHETANIDVAVKKNAHLIVCYNPFRPYDPEGFIEGFAKRNTGSRLAASGVLSVLNQILRAFFHARLAVALDHFRKSPSFKGDIILIEPRASDEQFFALNPLSLDNRVKAAMMGFESVHSSIERRFDEVAAIFKSYGIKMARNRVAGEIEKMRRGVSDIKGVQAILEGRKYVSRKKRG